MWQYNDTYLAHYGKLGMKWGKRSISPTRGRKALARTSAITEKTYGRLKTKQEMQKRIVSEEKAVGYNNPKATKKLEKLNNKIQLYEKIHDKTYSSLSQAEIDKGKKAVAISSVLSVGLTGPMVGAAIISGRMVYDKKIATRYINQ